MMENNRRFLGAPVFEDEEKTNAAYLLNFITIAYFLISASAVTAAFFASTDFQETIQEALIRTAPLLVVLVITQIAMRMGRVRGASIFLGVLLWITTIFNTYISGGATSDAAYVFIPVVMIFGLLTGRRYAIISAVASFLVMIALFIIENLGYLPEPISSQSPITSIFTFFVVIFLTTSLLYMYRMRLDVTLENLQEANLALEQAGSQLEKQVATRTRALEISTEVSRRLSTILDRDQLVREVVEQLRTAFGYYHVHIYLYDEFRQKLVMAGGTGDVGRRMLAMDHKLEPGQGLVGQAALDNQSVLIPDVLLAEGWRPNPLLPETKSELAVPIAIGQDVLGVLDVQHNVTGGLTQQDAGLVQSIANQVAIAVQNAQAYTRTQQQAAREAQITAINQRIQSATSIEEVLQIGVSELGQTLGAKRSSVELVNPNLKGNPS